MDAKEAADEIARRFVGWSPGLERVLNQARKGEIVALVQMAAFTAVETLKTEVEQLELERAGFQTGCEEAEDAIGRFHKELSISVEREKQLGETIKALKAKVETLSGAILGYINLSGTAGLKDRCDAFARLQAALDDERVAEAKKLQAKLAERQTGHESEQIGGYLEPEDALDEATKELQAEVKTLKQPPTWLCAECLGQWEVSSRATADEASNAAANLKPRGHHDVRDLYEDTEACAVGDDGGHRTVEGRDGGQDMKTAKEWAERGIARWWENHGELHGVSVKRDLIFVVEQAIDEATAALKAEVKQLTEDNVVLRTLPTWLCSDCVNQWQARDAAKEAKDA